MNTQYLNYSDFNAPTIVSSLKEFEKIQFGINPSTFITVVKIKFVSDEVYYRFILNIHGKDVLDSNQFESKLNIDALKFQFISRIKWIEKNTTDALNILITGTS